MRNENRILTLLDSDEILYFRNEYKIQGLIKRVAVNADLKFIS